MHLKKTHRVVSSDNVYWSVESRRTCHGFGDGYDLGGSFPVFNVLISAAVGCAVLILWSNE